MKKEFIVEGLAESSNLIVDLKNIRNKEKYAGALNQDTLTIIADLLDIKLNFSLYDDGNYNYIPIERGKIEANIGLKGGHYYALLSKDDVLKLINDNHCIARECYKSHNDEKYKILKSQKYYTNYYIFLY